MDLHVSLAGRGDLAARIYAGVAVNTLAQLRADAGGPGTPGRDGLVLGYGAVRPDRIMPGLRRLAASLAVTGRPSRPAARSRRVSVSR